MIAPIITNGEGIYVNLSCSVMLVISKKYPNLDTVENIKLNIY